MKPKQLKMLIALAFLFITLLGSYQAARAWQALKVSDDPLVRMPGTQPGQNISIDTADQCTFCHFGYDQNVEPGYNWGGSMMAQASRDFLFWADLTVANQDAIWAFGTPNGADICLRCHVPRGWLEGRSDPSNASQFRDFDFDGVQCGFCHQLFDPFYADSYAGTRESSDWLNYWDETNASGSPSQPAADRTFAADAAQALSIRLFNNDAFYQGDQPFSSGYIENSSGQFFVSSERQKRGPFADARARHTILFSRYHKSKYFCSTCHDISNPLLANLGADPSQPLPSESDSGFSYYHIERTFSEFMLSAYGREGGAAGLGPYAPAAFTTSLANNYITSCQDCHMRDVVGQASFRMRPPVRPDQSVEHPQSGMPLHDLTGGNSWVSTVLASTVPSSPNYDPTNESLLKQGPDVLTLDLSQGSGMNANALLAGANRAIQQLEQAASFEAVVYDPASGQLSLRIQNQTGHKLISGFPEGRRMFLNVKAFNGTGQVIYELNPYDYTAGTLRGLDPAYALSSPPLQAHEVHLDEFVYEIKPTSSLTGETKSFHFMLATGRYKDNRIPPVGFDSAAASERMSEPVWHGASDSAYFTAEEYAGGYDAVTLLLPQGAQRVEINLYYQITSREYIEFLRDEIKGEGNLTLSSPTLAGEPEAYIVQTDPHFRQLKAWGDTIWELWWHNKQLPGAAPVPMTQAVWQGAQNTCSPPTPTLNAAAAADSQVRLTWSDEHSADSQVAGYRVYYDLAGQAQLLAETGLTTNYVDSGLTNGQEYCYKVTAYESQACESGFSNVICALPESQATAAVSVASLRTGRYTTAGDPTTFVEATAFAPGDVIVFRAVVVNASTGQPLANAVVDLQVSGPQSLALTSGPSDAQGRADASWQTQSSRGRGRFATPGTTPGAYSVTLVNLSLDGWVWDGVQLSADFSIQ